MVAFAATGREDWTGLEGSGKERRVWERRGWERKVEAVIIDDDSIKGQDEIVWERTGSDGTGQ